MAAKSNALSEVFLAETGRLLDKLEQSLIQLETRADDAEFLAEIFRWMHTIKGNTAVVELSAATQVSHAAEDVLVSLREREVAVTVTLIDGLLEAVDALRRLTADPAMVGAPLSPEDEALIGRLRETASGGISPVAPRAPSTEAAPARPTLARRSLDVDLDRLDRILRLTAEMAIAHGRLANQLRSSTAPIFQAAIELMEGIEGLQRDLQGEVMDARMVPVGPSFQRQARTVRNIAGAQGKEARLVVEGGDVELDATVTEAIRDPLTHMVRNAVDHGLETPEGRSASGKDPCGCVTLRASHEGGMILLEVADDGAGLAFDAIRERARARGRSGVDLLTEAELSQLIFEPGFSTATEVTDVSGRGVGMDVVRRSVELLRGTISISSVAGAGTTLSIRLPLTLAIIDGFSVTAGDETYIIPLASIIECIPLPAHVRVNTDGALGVFDLRGDGLPFVRLRRLFDIESRPPARESLVVVRSGELTVGIVVDELGGHSQAVIKPLGRMFRSLPGISGSTILGNGNVALIVDVPAILQEANRLQGETWDENTVLSAQTRRQQRMSTMRPEGQ